MFQVKRGVYSVGCVKGIRLDVQFVFSGCFLFFFWKSGGVQCVIVLASYLNVQVLVGVEVVFVVQVCIVKVLFVIGKGIGNVCYWCVSVGDGNKIKFKFQVINQFIEEGVDKWDFYIQVLEVLIQDFNL